MASDAPQDGERAPQDPTAGMGAVPAGEPGAVPAGEPGAVPRLGASEGKIAAPRTLIGRPRAAPGDAFAATMAPESMRPPVLPIGSTSVLATVDMVSPALESGETITAPTTGDLLPLPTVPASLYRPDHEIARGGMGRIVAAEDQRLGRPVALKELLEPSPEQLGRFQREALITARLQHPGIVPVYEAGCWPSGEPFFAMKLVSGRPLDQVIGAAARLEDRLALLPRIAAATEAIAYAHSQRVIHRDLKPANILIGEFGETVVIDWGLAKSLDDVGPETDQRVTRPRAPHVTGNRRRDPSASTLTVAGAVMGTPAYMAPEQARGEPLDQRADVFALGAMLYHLLAGVPPYKARTATDVIAAAALGKVVPLAERERGAPPDLVAIVQRAMAPLPAERYADAGELATELRRFLTGQLVSAHRYTAAERLGRFIRRHRAAVTIGVLASIGFAAGGTFAVRRIVHERDVADHARQLADTRRQAAEHLIDKMLSDVKIRLEQIGHLDLLASLGTEIRDYYGTLAKIPGGMPVEEVDRMARAVDLVGRAEHDSGKLDQALATWTSVREELARTIPPDGGEVARRKREILARLDREIGTIHQQRGRIDLASKAYTQAKHEFDALRDEPLMDHSVLLEAAETHDLLGDLLRNDGKLDQAFEEYEEARTERERAAADPKHRSQEEELALSTSHLKLGSVFQVRGESAKALEEYRTTLRLREDLLGRQHDNVELREKVLEIQFPLGDLQRQIGDPKGARETYEKALPSMEGLTRRDPENTTWRRLRGNLESDFGFALLDAGDYKAAIEQLDVAIAIQRELVDRNPQSTTWKGDLSRSYTRAGDARLHLGEIDRGIAQYRLALEIRQKLVAINPRSAPYRRSVAWSHAKLANAYVAKHDVPHAIAAHEQALALRTKLVDESPAQGGFRNELASTEAALGMLLAASDPPRSKLLIESGLARSRALVGSDPINNEWKETLTQGLLAEADTARTTNDAKLREAALAEALAVAREGAEHALSNVHWPEFLAEIHAGLAELATGHGDPRAATAEWRLVRDLLEPLATTNRLAAQHKALLDRARAAR